MKFPAMDSKRSKIKCMRDRLAALPLAAKAVAITLLALLFSKVAVFDLSSVSFFAPMEKVSDFQFSDFYSLVADNRGVAEINDRIVIVPVDGSSRNEIARALDDMDFCEPAAVGLDVLFSAPRNPGNDSLANALARCRNLVMPIMTQMQENDALAPLHVSHYDSVVNPHGGFASIMLEGRKGERLTVRSFSAAAVAGRDTILGMPAALAKIAAPEAYATLLSRNNEEETIKFAALRFDTVAPDDILANPDKIEGRIVLVGRIHDPADTHVTPLDNFTPGLLIHAYTTATILSQDYIRNLNIWESYTVAALIGCIVVWLNLLLSQSPVGQLTVRIVQLALLYAMIVVGTQVYIRYGVDLNFSMAMVTIALGCVACDVFIGVFDENGIIDLAAAMLGKCKRIYLKLNNQAR